MKKYSKKEFAEAALELLEKYSKKEVVKLLAQEIISQKWASEIDIIVKEIGKQMLVKKSILNAEIITARELSDSIKKEITSLLKKITSAETVSLNSVIDPSIIGGFKAITPVIEINGSIKEKINKLKAKVNV